MKQFQAVFNNADGYRSGLGPRPPRGDRGGRFPNTMPREERNNRRNEDRPRDFG